MTTHINVLVCVCIISTAAALPVSDLSDPSDSVDFEQWGMPNRQPADLVEIETDDEGWWGNSYAKDRSCKIDKIEEIKVALAAAVTDPSIWKGWDTEGAIKSVTATKKNHFLFTYHTCWALKAHPTLEVEVKPATTGYIKGVKVDGGFQLIKKSGNIQCNLDGDGSYCSAVYLQGNTLHWRSNISLRSISRSFMKLIVGAVQRMSNGDFKAVCKRYTTTTTRRRRWRL